MQAFQITLPHTPKIPVIASIPHTGTFVPDEINELMASDEVRKLPMTDWYLQELYDFLGGLGVTVLSANYSRYVIDLNRSPVPLELYPGRFETRLVAEKDFQGEPVFSLYPTDTQIEFYKNLVHAPYHAALQELLDDRKSEFGKVYLFDLHSIASQATLIHGRLNKDIYLGDRDGLSCSKKWSEEVAYHYRDQGLLVQHNNPYKGGYITHHYGQDEQVEALQIEMNQDVYMHSQDIENTLQSEKFSNAKVYLHSIFKALLRGVKV